jgi:nucleoside-diphosphate-sugar epimerase
MRVFVAGASGALGSRLVPQLIDAGHDVIGTHNSPSSAELLRRLGAEPVMLDLLDAGAVRRLCSTAGRRRSFTRRPRWRT